MYILFTYGTIGLERIIFLTYTLLNISDFVDAITLLIKKKKHVIIFLFD